MTENKTTKVSSETSVVEIHRALPTVVIGERINPTGRKKLQAEMEAGRFELVKHDSKSQVEAGASILDFNAGVADGDEPSLLKGAIRAVVETTDFPLCIDTTNLEALAAALKTYEGKPLVNSVNGEKSSLDRTLPLIKEHGAAVIGLCMDDDGIPTEPEKRLAIAEKIIEQASRLGIPVEDVVIDPLVSIIATDGGAAQAALRATELIVQEFGVNIAMGVSNVPF